MFHTPGTAIIDEHEAFYVHAAWHIVKLCGSMHYDHATATTKHNLLMTVPRRWDLETLIAVSTCMALSAGLRVQMTRSFGSMVLCPNYIALRLLIVPCGVRDILQNVGTT